MNDNARYEQFLTTPREDLGVECKDWLDLADGEHKADLAKPGSTEPATRFGCRDTQTGAPLKLG